MGTTGSCPDAVRKRVINLTPRRSWQFTYHDTGEKNASSESITHLGSLQ